MGTKSIVLTLLLALCIVFVGCAEDEAVASDTGITSLSFYSGAKSRLELKLGKTERGHFKVECEGEYQLSDIVLSNTAPDVVSFEYDKTVLGDYVYYNLEALSPGEAAICVKTSDGVIQSEEIKIIVTGEKVPEVTKAPETTKAINIIETLENDFNEKTYILNTDSKKYHIEGCFSANKIKETNIDTFTGTSAELEAMGYEACKNCH